MIGRVFNYLGRSGNRVKGCTVLKVQHNNKNGQDIAVIAAPGLGTIDCPNDQLESRMEQPGDFVDHSQAEATEILQSAAPSLFETDNEPETTEEPAAEETEA